jgi:hypothetical protein
VTEAKRKAIDYLVEHGYGVGKVNYRLRDWGISRQRYWGAPIPVLYCETCGMVPEKEENLPVVLPRDVQISGKGGSPLVESPAFVNATVPEVWRQGAARDRHDGHLRRVVVVLLRYCSPHFDGGMFERAAADYWMPVDQYIGGIEHAVLHLLYARFYTKVLRDLGLTKVDEPFNALLSQGMVIKDGAKMSKSKGNVVDPDDLIRTYGRGHRAAVLALRRAAREGPRLERPGRRRRLAVPQPRLALRGGPQRDREGRESRGPPGHGGGTGLSGARFTRRSSGSPTTSRPTSTSTPPSARSWSSSTASTRSSRRRSTPCLPKSAPRSWVRPWRPCCCCSARSART